MQIFLLFGVCRSYNPVQPHSFGVPEKSATNSNPRFSCPPLSTSRKHTHANSRLQNRVRRTKAVHTKVDAEIRENQSRRRRMVSYVSILLYGVGGLVVAGMALLVAFQEKLVYVPVVRGFTKSYTITPARLRLSYEDIWLRSSDGVRLHAWFIKLSPECRGSIWKTWFLNFEFVSVTLLFGDFSWQVFLASGWVWWGIRGTWLNELGYSCWSAVWYNNWVVLEIFKLELGVSMQLLG